ncbi:uncharacterized protein [Diabrotica undecimpunctata]|uniref:uncharacterized protein n=1 Tax=Diabrotica undecimpunctata TaxID=50387 RepID=UPI003B64179E
MKFFIVVFCFCILKCIANKYSDDLPESFDWRDEGAVLGTPTVPGIFCAKSDWAYAIANAVETQLFLANGTLESFSPQYILDCCSFSDGCNNGPSIETAYACLERNGGVNSQYSYFDGMQRPCFGGANLPIQFEIWNKISEEELKRLLVTRGILNVMINGANLRSYTGGIWLSDDCNKSNPDPWTVNLIGYGRENDTDYWILKNWVDSSWGEGGFFRLIRNQNACGITDKVLVPMVVV